MRARRIVRSVCVFALVTGAGCSTGTQASGITTPGATSTAAPRASRTAVSPPASTRSSQPITPRATPSPSSSATFPGGAFVELGRRCGRRGIDTQSVVAKTRANGPVGFNTRYADGSYYGDGSSDYKAGGTPSDHPFADAGGGYRATWTIPADAPVGSAVVIGAIAEGQFALSFTIVAANERC